jgi:hypothetical protein
MLALGVLLLRDSSPDTSARGTRGQTAGANETVQEDPAAAPARPPARAPAAPETVAADPEYLDIPQPDEPMAPLETPSTLPPEDLARRREKGWTARQRKHVWKHYEREWYGKSIEEGLRVLAMFPDMDDVRSAVIASACALRDPQSARQHLDRVSDTGIRESTIELCSRHGVRLP